MPEMVIFMQNLIFKHYLLCQRFESGVGRYNMLCEEEILSFLMSPHEKRHREE